jgi:death on curing protein
MDSGIRGSSSPPFSAHRSGITNTVAEEAAALMESLANNHPFLDGNKRIAFAGSHTFLLVNGYDLEVRPLAAYEFMMHSHRKRRVPFRANSRVDQQSHSAR